MDLVQTVVRDIEERKQDRAKLHDSLTEVKVLIAGGIKDGKTVEGIAHVVDRNSRSIGWIGKAIWMIGGIAFAALFGDLLAKVWL